MKKMIKNWPSHLGFTATINTTEDCNLRCKYCYEVNKKPGNADVVKCKKFLDFIFEDPNPAGMLPEERHDDIYDGLTLDLIGGDALMNVDILDDILKYANYKYLSNDKFRKNGWRVSISSNGTLFAKPEVRRFLEKWREHISIGVSIDGCPEIHDKNRIFCDGRGSMQTILDWWPWYSSVFPVNSKQTKATCNKDSIPYLYESLKWMHEELGLRWINQNFIMEDEGYSENDIAELDRQLEKCCNYCLEHCDDLYWSMFSHRFQNPGNDYKDNHDVWISSSCGIGDMLALSIQGDIYPCFRCLPQSQDDNSLCAGSILDKSVDKDFLLDIRRRTTKEKCTKDSKCLECPVESVCIWCASGCYKEHHEFIRTTHTCEIIKLQAKWAGIYKQRLEEMTK